MPAVTVALRPNGLPTASTHSPTCMPSEFPIFAVGSALGDSTLMTAGSVPLASATALAAGPSEPAGTTWNLTPTGTAPSTTGPIGTEEPLGTTVNPEAREPRPT